MFEFENVDILNYKRRKRQADENSKKIIEKFSADIDNKKSLFDVNILIHNEIELNNLIKSITDKVEAKALDIQPDWSIPIILEAIGMIYYGNISINKDIGVFFKRALTYLWKANSNVLSNKKNVDSLLEIIELSFVIENLYAYKRFFLVIENFSLTLNKGYCYFKTVHKQKIKDFGYLLQGKGRRLRIAEENSILMCTKGEEFLNALFAILKGKNPSDIQVFKGTFYEHIPNISNVECKKFWQSVFLRYWLFINAIVIENLDDNYTPSVTLFHEFSINISEDLFTQEIVNEVFWNKKWLESIDNELYGNLIVERPILRITQNGDFATCSALIGDSINNFIEEQILNYPLRSQKINLPPIIFKKAISAPFEEKVIRKFRDMGYLAGHVLESGIWSTQNKTIDLNCELKLYGEIDALAYMPDLNMSLLVECKVLNDVKDTKSYRNLVSKITDDSEGFQSKILKKREWVDMALTKYYKKDITTVCVLLTDIPLPIINFSNEDLIFTYYDNLFYAIEHILSKFKSSDENKSPTEI